MKIGSDPEFLFIKDGKVEYAYDLVKDARRIGHDGCDNIGELRPVATVDPLKHFDNIRKLILKIDQKYNGYQVKAGSSGGMNENSLGGHIHLDGKLDHCKYFDYYFSIPYLFIEEYPFNSERREEYGALGDARSNRHGWEFRVPPSWLVDPFVCRGTLCLAFTLEHEIDINEELKDISMIEEDRDIVRDLHAVGDLEFFNKYLKDIFTRIHNMKMYKDFQEEIDFLFKMIDLNRTWNEKLSIINIWKNYEEDLKQYNLDGKRFILSRRRYKGRRCEEGLKKK